MKTDLEQMEKLLSKRKVIYTLAFELINKQLKGTCDESEIEVEVSDSSHSCFSDASDTKTIDIGVLTDFQRIQLA